MAQVSVVIPTYNRWQRLMKAVSSAQIMALYRQGLMDVRF